MPDLKARFDGLEESRAILLKGVAALDGAMLNRKPDKDTWSINQVVVHLAKAERGILGYIRKKTQDPEALEPVGLMSGIRLAMITTAFWSPFRIKAPKGLSDLPESSDFQAISLDWAAVREDWRAFVGSFPEALRGKLVFRHPYVGMMSPEHTIGFMNQHVLNHTRQIGRIRKRLGV